ncbi:MAG: hypothetical protein ACREBS_06275 [Nitrososphaerales archaeon]
MTSKNKGAGWLALEESVVLNVKKKGVTILPKRLRDEAGVTEDSEVKERHCLSGGIVLPPPVEDPVSKLENLLPVAPGESVCEVYPKDP